jgi:D-alanyl-D-alanine carboxypeptidase/D-alanyl-D-alanine-endopeptidase (penicillin-binding protein 4)
MAARARRLTWSLLTVVALTLAPMPPAAGHQVPPAAGRPMPLTTLAPPQWMQDIRSAIGNRPVSVAIGKDGDLWFRHLDWVGRPPASNEKLLLSMALYDRYASWKRIPIKVETGSRPDAHGVIHGNLWIVGHGDPEIDNGRIGALARAVVQAGVHAIRGSVLGDTGPFRRDWWAKGWKTYFPADYVPLPTALTYRENTDAHGVHVRDPERRAAKRLTAQLEKRGVTVRGDPGMERAPAGLVPIATRWSAPLRTIIRHMDVPSRNFWAEVLGKRLGFDEFGHGTIAAAARAIDRFTDRHGQDFTLYDSSGLSYANRATTKGILQLLWDAGDEPWGTTLRGSLATSGQGTLKDRLAGIPIRAKTGTLDDASALSGWVRLETGRWVEFSILSNGFSEWTAKTIEDRIVRIVHSEATDPTP